MLNCNTAAQARANAGEWGVYRLERGGRGKPKLYCMCCVNYWVFCVWECAWTGEGRREMNLKHLCPPLRSHLLLNRFGGEQGLFCAQICTSLSLWTQDFIIFQEEREKGALVFTLETKIKAIQFCACNAATVSPFSQAFHSLVCILMGFVCFLPEGKADAKKSGRVSALASEAIDCRVQHREHALWINSCILVILVHPTPFWGSRKCKVCSPTIPTPQMYYSWGPWQGSQL